MNCHKVLREPNEIKLDTSLDATVPLRILQAGYGHVDDSTQAVDITDKIQHIVDESKDRGVLVIDKYTDLVQLLGVRPMPGEAKVRTDENRSARCVSNPMQLGLATTL